MFRVDSQKYRARAQLLSSSTLYIPPGRDTSAYRASPSQRVQMRRKSLRLYIQ